jgi:hypothetical protein
MENKNYLTLIIKSCNIAYPASVITEHLKQIRGVRNVVKAYFPRGDPARDLHVGACNLEVLNPIVYKQFVRKNIKLFRMHERCTPHPRNLDGTSCPTEQLLKEFGFTDINTAIVNAMTGISNQPTASSSQGVTMEQVVNLVYERIETVRKELK